MSLNGIYCLTPSSGNLFIYTFKEGMFSTMSHDLLINVTDFKISLDVPDGDMTSSSFNLEVNSNSLKVICAMKKGKRHFGALKNKDKAEIKELMEKDVLHTSIYSTINFCSTAIQQKEGHYLIKGDLSLHGIKRSIVFKANSSDNGKNFKGAVLLAQTHYGIKPFKALMGALKIQNKIKICFDLTL